MLIQKKKKEGGVHTLINTLIMKATVTRDDQPVFFRDIKSFPNKELHDLWYAACQEELDILEK